MKESKKVLDTRSGMWCIWNPKIAKGVNSYEDWEEKFYEDDSLLELIKEKLFVPINLQNNGALEFIIRIAPQKTLSEREAKYLLTTSNNYLIESDGILNVSGIEYIEETINESHVAEVETAQNIYLVSIDIIDWKKEPGMTKEDGTPANGALPDLIVHLNTPSNDAVISHKIETFRK